MSDSPGSLSFHKVISARQQDFEALLDFWQDLPLDPYLEGGFRYRAMTRFMISGGQLQEVPPEQVVQSSLNNPLFGDLPRSFKPLAPGLVANPHFISLCNWFLSALPIDTDKHVLWVHQIRVRHIDKHSHPVPEGIHRDERMFVGVLVVNMNSVRPGKTQLFLKPDEPPFFETELGAGDMIVFDDRQMYHYTGGFENEPAPEAVRDIFIFALTESDEEGTLRD